MKKFFIKNSQKLAAAAIPTSWAAYYGLEGLYNRFYCWDNSQYIDGKIVPVDTRTLHLVKEVAKDMKLPDDRLARLNVYYTRYLDSLTLGHLGRHSQGYLGLPFTFPLSRMEELDERNIRWQQEELNNDEDEQTFAQNRTILRNLLLPRQAKKFLIAQKLMYLDSKEDIVRLSIGSSTAYVYFQIVYIINRKYNIPARSSPLFHFFMYTCALVLTYFTYTNLSDFARVQLDRHVDQSVAALGSEYLSGGQTFYLMTLQRNRAYRSLMKQEGQKKFTPMGNEIGGSGAPLVTRLNWIQAFAESNTPDMPIPK